MQKYAAPAAVAFALVMVAVLALRPSQSGTGDRVEGEAAGGESVAVTLHIMSQCPYGPQAVDGFTPLARKLGPRMRLRLEYIGREEGGELTSMRGESEIQGNKLQLCVHEHGSYDNWLDFLDCQNRNFRQIPEGWERCARDANVDVDTVRACYEGEEGTRLLRASFQASQEAGARGSPTIVIGSERYAGSRTEQGYARAICAQYSSEPPRYCREIPPPPEVPVTILVDRRCDHEDCNVEGVESRLKGQIAGAKVQRIDYGTDQGREMFQKANLKMLPAVLIGREIQQDQEAARMVQGFQRSGDMFVDTIGRFDPTEGAWVPRPEVPITLLGDNRCKTRECESLPRFEAFIKRQIPNAKIASLDYSSEEGGALWRRIKTAFDNMDSPADPRRGPQALGLPFALFGETVTQETDTFSRLERRFQKIGDEYLFPLGPWDPTSEICDNEIDDDGDGLVDCRDPDCAQQLVCRPEKARELRAFLMSFCPHGIRVVDAMEEVLDNFGRDRSKINFRMEFIGSVGPDGELSSMQREPEVQEDLRQICAQHHYGANYAFMEYVLCRNKSIRSPEWEQCATGPVKAEVIRRCSEGDEGQRLLRESFELAKALGFGGSPSWLLNNRHEMNARDPESIKAAFCERNELPECANTLSKQPPRGAPGGAPGGGAGSCG